MPARQQLCCCSCVASQRPCPTEPTNHHHEVRSWSGASSTGLQTVLQGTTQHTANTGPMCVCVCRSTLNMWSFAKVQRVLHVLIRMLLCCVSGVLLVCKHMQLCMSQPSGFFLSTHRYVCCSSTCVHVLMCILTIQVAVVWSKEGFCCCQRVLPASPACVEVFNSDKELAELLVR